MHLTLCLFHLLSQARSCWFNSITTQKLCLMSVCNLCQQSNHGWHMSHIHTNMLSLYGAHRSSRQKPKLHQLLCSQHLRHLQQYGNKPNLSCTPRQEKAMLSRTAQGCRSQWWDVPTKRQQRYQDHTHSGIHQNASAQDALP